MDTAIISAIIGAFATVLVAVLQLKRESSKQHGHLMQQVKKVLSAQGDLAESLDDMRDDLRTHIESHDTPKPVPSKVAAKKAAPKKSK